MANLVEQSLESVLTWPFCFGQVVVRKTMTGGFVLTHRDEESLDDLQTFRNAEDAIAIAKYDDAGHYRPLKTMPNMRHGWRLDLATLTGLKRALDYLYPGRLAVFEAWKSGQLTTTPLRETLNRQSGMYRVAAKISDAQIDDLVANFCRSDGGCLRTILWKRDQSGAVASTKLPNDKFDPARDNASARKAPRAIPTDPGPLAEVPLLCQEACNLLVAECRSVVKSESERRM
jgi:sirohydrochlorin cobaltochelatase